MSQFDKPVIPRREEHADASGSSERLDISKRIVLVVCVASCVVGFGFVVLFDSIIDGYFDSMEERRSSGEDSTTVSF